MDFPAAHSMDSTWFAVDADGHVAFFDSGEGGAVPRQGFPGAGEAVDADLELGWVLAALLERRAAEDPEIAAAIADHRDLIGAIEEAVGGGDPQVASLAAALGVYVYACHEAWAAPYQRSAAVPRPARLADLPAEVQARLTEARLSIRFGDAPWIAPSAHVPSVTWASGWTDLDGVYRPDDSGGDPLRPEERPEVDSVRDRPADPTRALSKEELIAWLRDALAQANAASPGRPAFRGGPSPHGSAIPAQPEGFLAFLRRLFGG